MSDLARRTQEVQARRVDLASILDPAGPQLARALAGRIPPERFIRGVMTEARKTPHLAECTPESLLGGLFIAGQLGLEVGAARGLAYLVPYRNKETGVYEASLIIGYKGYVELFYRAGAKSVGRRLVREGDLFREGFDTERGEWMLWEPGPDPDREKRPWTGVIASVKTANGGIVAHHMTRAEVMRRKPSDTPFWRKWEDEMAMKTALRYLVKVAPSSTDLALAVEHDETIVRQIDGLPEPEVQHLALEEPERPQERPRAQRRAPAPERSQRAQERPAAPPEAPAQASPPDASTAPETPEEQALAAEAEAELSAEDFDALERQRYAEWLAAQEGLDL